MEHQNQSATLVENCPFFYSDVLLLSDSLAYNNRLSFSDKMGPEKGTERGCALLTKPRWMNNVFGPLCVSKRGPRLCSVKPEWQNRQSDSALIGTHLCSFLWALMRVLTVTTNGQTCTHTHIHINVLPQVNYLLCFSSFVPDKQFHVRSAHPLSRLNWI